MPALDVRVRRDFVQNTSVLDTTLGAEDLFVLITQSGIKEPQWELEKSLYALKVAIKKERKRCVRWLALRYVAVDVLVHSSHAVKVK